MHIKLIPRTKPAFIGLLMLIIASDTDRRDYCAVQ